MWRRSVWAAGVVAAVAVLLLAVTWSVPRKAVGGGAVPEPGAVVGAPDPVPVPVRTLPEPEAPETLVEYRGPVEHIFFHPLVIYPELAFDGDGLSRGYDDWFVTVKEFGRIVDSLYARGYVLVDFRSLFAAGTLERKPLMLPPGKKPLIISIDDLNYYQYMRANGNAYKLIVDADGKVKTYSRTPAGVPVISAEDEIIPILDSFVARHPDFSFQGAKGVIALTGYEGILGYRTNDRSAAGYAEEKQEALRVVQRLKETGWTFASHGWGHQDARKISVESLARDTRRWRDEVEPLIGPTDLYIYPFGSALAPSDPKLRMLQGEGFRIFCGVGPNPNLTVGNGYALMDRAHVDGMALRTQGRLLAPFFDAAAILDDVRPKR